MKIAIIGPFFLPALDGVEKVMLAHARHLAARGHEVHVVTSRLRYPKGRFDDVPALERHEGFTIHRCEVWLAHPGWRFFYLNNGGLLIKGLVATLKRIDPDVVHAHQIAAAAWAMGGAWYAWSRKKRFFYSPHYHPDIDLRRRLYNSLHFALNWLPCRTAKRILHLTKRDFAPFRREYPWVPAERLSVLPNGVDPPREVATQTRPPAEFRVLWVGRVDEPRKGFDVLRRAFAAARRPGWLLEVIGRISEETSHGLEREFGSAVSVRGMVSEQDLDVAYACADVFVMPSRYEGFGIPYIEAMRYGVPVVGTDVGGVPEVVIPGTGVLVPVDDVEALARAMQMLWSQPELRRDMGLRGKEWSGRFHWPAVVAGLEAAYIANEEVTGELP